MKVGRRIKKDEIPYKWVKARNVTINKKRLEEAAKEFEIEGQEDEREGQPLYGENQTELYIAEPIVDVSSSTSSLFPFPTLLCRPYPYYSGSFEMRLIATARMSLK